MFTGDLVYVDRILGVLPWSSVKNGQKAFRPGRNVIAVRVGRYGAQSAEQLFDPGLVGSLPMPRIQPGRNDAGRAAWVVVANTVLNLDETVTRR